ncbi:MAG: hypothetical protein LBU40_02045 [Methanobrevibacter sp.]|jgi:hypothetical protein|nr:hypothetical protein [Methanobrevibacter sp.]
MQRINKEEGSPIDGFVINEAQAKLLTCAYKLLDKLDEFSSNEENTDTIFYEPEKETGVEVLE